MSAGWAWGSGIPPRYVERFVYRDAKIDVYFAGTGEPSVPGIACESEDALRRTCEELARHRVLFSIGGRDGRGPADLMSEWQDAGQMPISFLRISWTRPAEWQLHEMTPDVQQWEIKPIGDLLASQPQEWSARVRR